jgi:hypothetical protein
MSGQAPIAGTGVSVLDEGLTLTATFDLTGKQPGLWDIVITSADGTEARRDGGLELFTGVSLHRVFPPTGGNAGERTVSLDGSRFVPGMTVKLSRAGEPDIAAFAVKVLGTSQAEASFTLAGRALGPWDVTVVKADGTSATLPAAFTVVPAERPRVQTSITGPGLVRTGHFGSFVITFTNTGNIDAAGVPIIQGIPRDATWTIIEQPPYDFPVPNAPEARKRPFVFLTDESPTATQNLLLPITVVRAGTPAVVVIDIALPGPGEFEVQATWDQFE